MVLVSRHHPKDWHVLGDSLGPAGLEGPDDPQLPALGGSRDRSAEVLRLAGFRINALPVDIRSVAVDQQFHD